MKYSLLFVFFFGVFTHGLSQNKESLERQRSQIIKEIEKTNSVLKNTKKDKELTIKDVKVINDQVNKRQDLVENIKEELVNSDQIIANNLASIDSLQSTYTQISNQYASYLQKYYVLKMTNNKWTYLLSSENLNNFLLRWRYMNQYEAFKDQKIKEINDLKSTIAIKNQEIDGVKKQKAELLVAQEETLKKLEADKKLKDEMLKKLNSKEKDLMTQLTQKQRERENLNTAIERVILAQLKAAQEAEDAALAARRAREKERELAKASPSSTTSTTPKETVKLTKEETFSAEASKLSNNFSENKGRLPWPVSGGNISSRFGNQAHPTLKEIMINNNGIDIQSAAVQSVQAVFEGEVVSINNIPGMKTMIIIKHGSYYTVYSHLEGTNVSKGQKVKSGTTLGPMGINDNGKAEVHFELWKDKLKQNPESWLRR